MKVLIADRFEQSGIDGLKTAGLEVLYQPDLKGAALVDAIGDDKPEVLVVRGTDVTSPMLESDSLSLVVRAGAGYNTIDLSAASKCGIYVSNCPGRNAIAVAELAFGLILALDRRIPDNVSDLRAGTWNKKEYSHARGLFGRTLGLLGFGNIGREMARRAQGFGMRTIAWSRSLASGAAQPDPAIPVTVVGSPLEAAEQSDILSVHLALTPATRGIVDERVIARMKPGSYFINTARAEVVDYRALEKVVRDRGIRVGLDVFVNEPSEATGSFSDRLLSLPGVYGTHHIGGSTDQAQEAIAAEVVRVIVSYKTTGKVPNAVNLARNTPATHALIVRHRDRPGVLAHVFDCLRTGRINVQETENVIFEGAQAAVARINLDGAPSSALMASIQEGNSDILDLQLVTL